MDEGGDGSTLRLVVVALDSGNLAEDQLATMIPSEPAPNRVLELLGLGRTAEWFNRRPVKPAAEQLRKASNALDAFHRDLEMSGRQRGRDVQERL